MSLQPAENVQKMVGHCVKRHLDAGITKGVKVGRNHGQTGPVAQASALKAALWLFVYYAVHYVPVLRDRQKFLELCGKLHDDAIEMKSVEALGIDFDQWLNRQ